MNVTVYYDKVAQSYWTNGLATSRYLKPQIEKLFESIPSLSKSTG